MYEDEYDEEVDPIDDYQQEYNRQHPEYDRTQRTIPRRKRNRSRTNLLAVLMICGTAILIIGAGVFAYYSFTKTNVSNPYAGLSPDDIVNKYNAEHGITINGETLTPSNGVDPTVAAYFANQGTQVPPAQPIQQDPATWPTAPPTPTAGGPTSQVSDFPWVGTPLAATTPNFGTPGMVCIDHFVQEKNCDASGCYYVSTDTMNARIPVNDQAFYDSLQVGQKLTTNCYYQ